MTTDTERRRWSGPSLLPTAPKSAQVLSVIRWSNGTSGAYFGTITPEQIASVHELDPYAAVVMPAAAANLVIRCGCKPPGNVHQPHVP